MKKILKVMLVIMMAVMVTACGGGDNTDSGDKKETKLLIGISPDYPPYESLNTKNEMEGFDIDMTKELVDIMNKMVGIILMNLNKCHLSQFVQVLKQIKLI